MGRREEEERRPWVFGYVARRGSRHACGQAASVAGSGRLTGPSCFLRIAPRAAGRGVVCMVRTAGFLRMRHRSGLARDIGAHPGHHVQ
jgi:hypothetical protein